MRVKNKGSPIDKICKLLLNSLYGRFGMSTVVESNKVIKSRDLSRMKEKYHILNITAVSDKHFIVNRRKDVDDSKKSFANTIDVETAVHIVSAVTAYSRMYMYKFKHLKDNKCGYTDTDSVFLEKELDSKFIGREIGKFKLEYKIKRGVFIASKIYELTFHDNSKKTVIKGVKKNEISKFFSREIFDKALKNDQIKYVINRINLFKRNLIMLNIRTIKTRIELKFPFNKRRKIFSEDGMWVDTESIRINKIED